MMDPLSRIAAVAKSISSELRVRFIDCEPHEACVVDKRRQTSQSPLSNKSTYPTRSGGGGELGTP